MTESVTWPGAGATAPVQSTTALSPPAGCLLGRDRIDRAPRCSTPPACRSPTRQVSISGPTLAVAEHDRRRLRVLRVPDARRVHGVGHRGHRCQRPGSADPQPVDVGDGRPDVVADVQLRHRRDDHGHRIGRAVGRDAGDEHPDRSREHRACSRTASTRTRRERRRSTPLFPYPAGYTVFAGNCTDNNPIGLDTIAQPLLQQPGHGRPSTRHARRHVDARRCRSTTCP